MNGNENNDNKGFSAMGLRASRKTFKKSKEECMQHHGVVKSTGFITFALILSNIIITLFFVIIITDIRHVDNNFARQQSSMEEDLILTAKDQIEATAYGNLLKISNDVKDDIYETFDMNYLENELNHSRIPEQLSEIFYKHFNNVSSIPGLDPSVNDIVVCMEDGLIEEFSKLYATSDLEESRTWENEIGHQLNPMLFSNSIHAILDQNTKIFYAEQIKPLYSDETENEMIEYMDEDVFHDIYTKYGLEGIKNFNFFVPMYVEMNGDLFGKADIINGHKVKNNKIILIQRYNLYDYIKQHNIDVRFENDIENQIQNTILTLELGALIIIILIFLITFAMIRNVNTISNGDNIHKKNKAKSKEKQDVD